ncbi:hypothetical protein [uncultured Sulfitobacter sp.]|uniref:Acg family FMN-binding oxidoreductase n=1 Tax=uncultured Sulfitobacter sp. TaxID=191468 RepID=UPI0026101752|nr:hypothetical protein [uncultured Sulfitobacter sp.]
MINHPHSLWGIDENNFPVTAKLPGQIKFLIGYAVLAPSGHNTQPWLFRIGDQFVDVIADRTRALPVVDPHDRELTISCGAAVRFLEVAARKFGLSTEVSIMPDGPDSDTLARIGFSKGEKPTQQDQALFRAIPDRRTNRTAFEMEELPDSILLDCKTFAASVDVELACIEDLEDRLAIAALVAEGDQVQFADPHFRRELGSWVHSRRSHSHDGMSGASFGMPDILSSVGGFVIRTFDIGKGIAAADKEKIVSATPALFIIASSETPEGWINTGRALGQIALLTTSAGLSLSYLNQPIETDPLRPEVKALSGLQKEPQILIRIGRATKQVDATVRRDPAEVILTTM